MKHRRQRQICVHAEPMRHREVLSLLRYLRGCASACVTWCRRKAAEVIHFTKLDSQGRKRKRIKHATKPREPHATAGGLPCCSAAWRPMRPSRPMLYKSPFESAWVLVSFHHHPDSLVSIAYQYRDTTSCASTIGKEPTQLCGHVDRHLRCNR
jgi:hypothetical protein